MSTPTSKLTHDERIEYLSLSLRRDQLNDVEHDRYKTLLEKMMGRGGKSRRNHSKKRSARGRRHSTKRTSSKNRKARKSRTTRRR
jgi:hypothetical protein